MGMSRTVNGGWLPSSQTSAINRDMDIRRRYVVGLAISLYVIVSFILLMSITLGRLPNYFHLIHNYVLNFEITDLNCNLVAALDVLCRICKEDKIDFAFLYVPAAPELSDFRRIRYDKLGASGLVYHVWHDLPVEYLCRFGGVQHAESKVNHIPCRTKPGGFNLNTPIRLGPAPFRLTVVPGRLRDVNKKGRWLCFHDFSVVSGAAACKDYQS